MAQAPAGIWPRHNGPREQTNVASAAQGSMGGARRGRDVARPQLRVVPGRRCVSLAARPEPRRYARGPQMARPLRSDGAAGRRGWETMGPMRRLLAIIVLVL